MIVDMLRNDLGQVAEVGSVRGPALFEVERYPTLLQMTSTVTARCRAPLSRVISALFPCASVTGAPKKRTMEIVAAIESAPGACTRERSAGRPGRDRLVRCRDPHRARRPGAGHRQLRRGQRRRGRLPGRARVRGVPAEGPGARVAGLRPPRDDGLPPARATAGSRATSPGSSTPRATSAFPSTCGGSRRRCGGPPRPGRRCGRGCSCTPTGGSRCRGGPCPPRPPARSGSGSRRAPSIPAASGSTTRPPAARSTRPRSPRAPTATTCSCWNDRGELTESSAANVIVEVGGQRLTPPLACGVLPGVERARAIAEGRAREAVVRLTDLRPGQRLWLVSSLRGAREARLVG